MLHKINRILIIGTALLILAGCGAGDGQKSTIVLYGFSALENVMKDEIIPAFQRDWKVKTGQQVQVVTSFAGSGTITNQIVFGAPAQVAMVSTEMDALHIKDAGLVSTDWRDFRNEGSFAYSIACIVTRKGNPKAIYSFEDTGREGIDVVYPDPTTSGGAQWAILALYGSALKAAEITAEADSQERARELLKRVSLNAGSLPESARRALTQFGLGYGDALLTYENEALSDIHGGKEYEVVVPESTIYVEPKVMIVDKNVREGQRELVMAFVEYLWTKGAQAVLAENHFRVWDEELMARYPDRYVGVEFPFTVDYLGGWEEATSKVIDSTWRQVQREIN